MAKLSSSFHCMICKQRLNFPPNIKITDFVILMLQFNNNHDLCENMENAPKLEAKEEQSEEQSLQTNQTQ